MPGRLFLVDGDDCISRVVGMCCGHVPGGTSADDRWVGAGQHLGGVGGVFGQLGPDKVGGHKAEGTSNVVLGTLVPCLGFDILEPVLEVSSRIDGEGVGKGDGRGLSLRHGGWVDGWMSTRV